MPPGVESSPNQTPLVSASVAPTTYGTENVIIDGETSPLVSVVVHDDSSDDKLSQPVCRDLPFAILFCVHAIVMAWLGIFTAPQGYDEIKINATAIEEEIRKGDDMTDEDMKEFEEFVSAAAAYLQVYPVRILVYIIVPCCLLAYVLGAVSTAFIIKPYPKIAVYGCLVSAIAWMVVIMIGSAIASGSIFVLVGTGLALAASIYYVSIAWKMVPFAAVNLKIALEGMGRNNGMYLVAFLFAELGFCWVLYWFYTVVGKSVASRQQF